jgi:hypothetical protein
MTMQGLIRVVFEKRVAHAGGDGFARGARPVEERVEVLMVETFETGLCGGRGPAGVVAWVTGELGVEEQVLEASRDLGPGFYELVGEVWYEYDPGVSTPDHPAEPDAWWELRNEAVGGLTDEQAGWFMDADPVLQEAPCQN